MRLGNMKFTFVLMTGVAIVLPLSLLVSLLMAWKSPNPVTAKEIESPSMIKDAPSQGGSSQNGVQGKPLNTNTLPRSQNNQTEVGDTPLGAEVSIEELRRIKEGRGNIPVPQVRDQQEDSSK